MYGEKTGTSQNNLVKKPIDIIKDVTGTKRHYKGCESLGGTTSFLNSVCE